MGSTGALPIMEAEMLGDKARAARARGRDGDGLACTGSRHAAAQ
jgi:hypothetical protein